MTDFFLPLLAGFATGILSAWGVGGGTLLLLVMTLLLQVDPVTARGINLLYFLPAAGAGLVYHRKSGLLDRPSAVKAAAAGIPAAAAAAWLGAAVDAAALEKLFGLYLLLAGLVTLWQCRHKKK